MRTRKLRLRQRLPLILKCVLEKTEDPFWKLKLGTDPARVRRFHNERRALRP